MQKELLLTAIIDPARSSIITITESSGTLLELWEELNFKFGDSSIVVQNYMQLHLKTGTIPTLNNYPKEALHKLEEYH